MEVFRIVNRDSQSSASHADIGSSQKFFISILRLRPLSALQTCSRPLGTCMYTPSPSTAARCVCADPRFRGSSPLFPVSPETTLCRPSTRCAPSERYCMFPDRAQSTSRRLSGEDSARDNHSPTWSFSTSKIRSGPRRKRKRDRMCSSEYQRGCGCVRLPRALIPISLSDSALQVSRSLKIFDNSSAHRNSSTSPDAHRQLESEVRPYQFEIARSGRFRSLGAFVSCSRDREDCSLTSLVRL